MGSGGVGSAQHLYGALFKRMTGIDVLHVPYRGGGPALNDLLGGHVQMMIDTLVTSIGHIRSGELRALGVTTAKRLDVLPDVPAIGEVVPGFVGTGWVGIGAPRDTPAEIVNRLNKEVNLALADPSFGKRLSDLGAETFATSPSEFRRFIAEYTEKWAKLIREENIRAE
jgi:tripartite-type tricarboxylate transporter receptor subunit TctC